MLAIIIAAIATFEVTFYVAKSNTNERYQILAGIEKGDSVAEQKYKMLAIQGEFLGGYQYNYYNCIVYADIHNLDARELYAELLVSDYSNFQEFYDNVLKFR
jgi:hypothetical protein